MKKINKLFLFVSLFVLNLGNCADFHIDVEVNLDALSPMFIRRQFDINLAITSFTKNIHHISPALIFPLDKKIEENRFYKINSIRKTFRN